MTALHGQRRRTQAERRQQTQRRLLDATIEAINELGYARASTSEICRRAGVSQGGLFRHYPTRVALLIAAAADVSRQQLERFELAVSQLPVRGVSVESLEFGLRFCRDACRSDIDAVWHELLIASRCDSELRGALLPLHIEYRAAVRESVVRWLGLPAHTDDLVRAAAGMAVDLFLGEAISASVVPESDRSSPESEHHIQLIAAAMFGMLSKLGGIRRSD